MGAAPQAVSFFFFNDTATTEIYTLSLHDALPILDAACVDFFLEPGVVPGQAQQLTLAPAVGPRVAKVDRKSTRLNSSHLVISYAVFCLKKKNQWLLPIIMLRPTMTYSRPLTFPVN